MTANTSEIQKHYKGILQELHANKIRNIEEMDKFPEMNKTKSGRNR